MAPKPFWLKIDSEAAKQIKNSMWTFKRKAKETYFCEHCGMFIFTNQTHWVYTTGKGVYRFHLCCMRNMENSDE